MGRPFDEELDLLPRTCEWALRADVDALAKSVAMCSHLPLRIVGSGGSLSAAVFASELHQSLTSQMATAITPLGVVAHPIAAHASASLFLSASGRNPDIIGAFRAIAERSVPCVSVVCMQRHSPLGRCASSYPHVDAFEFDPPAGRDGFLATNSLIATCVLLARAYAMVFGVDLGLPPGFEELLRHCSLWQNPQHRDEDPFAPLWDRPTTIVLHGASSQSAATDLESKLTEAALSSAQVSDYRNFAHGRHHWLAKRASTTGVLAMITDDDRDLAERTLVLIPRDVPVVKLDVALGGPAASLALLAWGMRVTRSAGTARGIDPGRPQVPAFGRRLYHLNAFTRSHKRASSVPLVESLAIERKAGIALDVLERSRALEHWRSAYRCFVRRLGETRFSGLALDYDGTLCDRDERFEGISPSIASELERLLAGGVVVGIATGRGRSVRNDLQRKLAPALWGGVMIGYYNAAEIGPLGDDGVPHVAQDLGDALLPIADGLSQRSDLAKRAEISHRRHQITLQSVGCAPMTQLWEVVQEVIQGLQVPGVTVLRSSHSVDVLAPGVSKLSLVERLRDLVDPRADPAILCIGDRGRWPGNDFALLSHPYSLSVDEVSRDPGTCWNISPPGHLGARGALNYLGGLQRLDAGSFMVRLPRAGSAGKTTLEFDD